MEEAQTVQELTIQVRAIFAAIPGVLFALWVDHFERSFLSDTTTLFKPEKIETTDSEATRTRKETHNRQAALAREQAGQLLRAVGFTAFLTQLLIYFSVKDVPGASGSYSFFFAAIAIGIQWKLLQDAEAKLAPPKTQVVQPPQDEKTGIPYRRRPKPIQPLGLILSFVGYFSLVAGSALGFFATALTLGARPEVATLFGGFGILLGILGGIALIYALAPWNIQRLYPIEKLRDVSTLRTIERAFKNSGLSLPKCYILEHEDIQSHNAMIAGFQSGRWIFRPSLFITRSLIENFSPHEIESIVLHELSHVVLQHLRRRLLLTAGLISGFVLISAVTGITFHLLLPISWAQTAQLITGVLAVLLPFPLVKRQIRNQELEADRFAITHLGASPEAAITALEKLDTLNHRDPKQSAGSHPSTEERIQNILEAAKNRKVVRLPEKNSTPDSDQKAA